MTKQFPSHPEELKGVFLYSRYPGFSVSPQQDLKKWVLSIIANYHLTLHRLDIYFITDDALLEINQEFLNHDTYTDIITFPYQTDPLLAEIYISVDRIAENARTLQVALENEMLRVIVHGILHLCGLGDKTVSDAQKMHSTEDAYLALWHQNNFTVTCHFNSL